jgi:hypothetical protein
MGETIVADRDPLTDREGSEERVPETDHTIDYAAEARRIALRGGQTVVAERVLLIHDPQAAFIDAVQGGIGHMGG